MKIMPLHSPRELLRTRKGRKFLMGFFPCQAPGHTLVGTSFVRYCVV